MCSSILIPLDKGKFALIDASDKPIIDGHRWIATEMGRNWYAVASVWTNGKKRTVLMHRLILAAPAGMEVDHRSGDGLDNRRENIRLATHSENLKNIRIPISNRSWFKGVHFHKRTRKWRAQIRSNGVHMSLGLFNSPEEAAAAYDSAALSLHGQFARTNATLIAGKDAVCHL